MIFCGKTHRKRDNDNHLLNFVVVNGIIYLLLVSLPYSQLFELGSHKPKYAVKSVKTIA